MNFINIGKTACENCLVKGIKHFTIFDIWKLFGENWDIENTKELNLELLEKRAIENALEISKNIQIEAAGLLGITARSLHYKMRKHEIKTWRQKEKIHIIDNSPKQIKKWKEMELCEI